MTSAERLCLVAARSEALLVDFVVVFLVRWGLKILGVGYIYFQPVLDQAKTPLAISDFVSNPASAIFYGSMFFVSGLPNVVFASLWCLYAIVMISLCGQTLGMRQAGIRLIDGRGKKPGIVRVIVRQLLVPVSSIAWLGIWQVAWTPNATALHDTLSGTRVVQLSKSKPAQDPSMQPNSKADSPA